MEMSSVVFTRVDRSVSRTTSRSPIPNVCRACKASILSAGETRKLCWRNKAMKSLMTVSIIITTLSENDASNHWSSAVHHHDCDYAHDSGRRMYGYEPLKRYSVFPGA